MQIKFYVARPRNSAGNLFYKALFQGKTCKLVEVVKHPSDCISAWPSEGAAQRDLLRCLNPDEWEIVEMTGEVPDNGKGT
jgi:hypothetical protein